MQKQYTQTETEQNLMLLADNMAAAATTFNSHGYDMFIDAREKFKETLHEAIAATSKIPPAE